MKYAIALVAAIGLASAASIPRIADNKPSVRTAGDFALPFQVDGEAAAVEKRAPKGGKSSFGKTVAGDLLVGSTLAAAQAGLEGNGEPAAVERRAYKGGKSNFIKTVAGDLLVGSTLTAAQAGLEGNGEPSAVERRSSKGAGGKSNFGKTVAGDLLVGSTLAAAQAGLEGNGEPAAVERRTLKDSDRSNAADFGRAAAGETVDSSAAAAIRAALGANEEPTSVDDQERSGTAEPNEESARVEKREPKSNFRKAGKLLGSVGTDIIKEAGSDVLGSATTSTAQPAATPVQKRQVQFGKAGLSPGPVRIPDDSLGPNSVISRRAPRRGSGMGKDLASNFVTSATIAAAQAGLQSGEEQEAAVNKRSLPSTTIDRRKFPVGPIIKGLSKLIKSGSKAMDAVGSGSSDSGSSSSSSSNEKRAAAPARPTHPTRRSSGTTGGNAIVGSKTSGASETMSRQGMMGYAAVAGMAVAVALTAAL
ncbi:hypothetical protein BT67DRAFT_121130 [Trichocladium antarcticum]|uniref:Uncharacterized protein n=1 Tax=Trichocladium antarcticum TaxID=1450529 RepID=A0AAN6USB7_9PEZI|nr:hypothetical protein BT67DRAFT_121130 [Trichocladium antarcticum]